MATVLLTRHGETAWNREDRIQGWAPTRLTDRGHAEAQTLAAHVADARDVDRLLSSDLLRARRTAAHVADATGLEPRHAAAWRERDFGRLQGLLKDDMLERFPAHARDVDTGDTATEPIESGESLAATRERVLDGWRDLAGDLDAGTTTLVVCHGGPLRLLVGAIRGQDAVESLWAFSPTNCGLTTVEVSDDAIDPAAATLECVDETAFL